MRRSAGVLARRAGGVIASAVLVAAVGGVAGAVGCSTAGSTWVTEPQSSAATSSDPRTFEPPAPRAAAVSRRPVKRILEHEPDERRSEPRERGAAEDAGTGTELGTFRNTYYNFPHQLDYRGPEVSLFDTRCRPLARVPRAFHDTLCVQGSGSLANGRTASFARRHCDCARTCPRTGQQICFDTLDPAAFPWGRGAAGTAIVPLRSVAVDVSVIPLGTRLFIPEFVGLPMEAGAATHDGCFLAEDRGIKVIGQHVDIFTGRVAQTKRWDALVPTNRGVTVFVDSPRCANP